MNNALVLEVDYNDPPFTINATINSKLDWIIFKKNILRRRLCRKA